MTKPARHAHVHVGGRRRTEDDVLSCHPPATDAYLGEGCTNSSAVERLCSSVRALMTASCEDLQDSAWLKAFILRKVGLAYQKFGADALYGPGMRSYMYPHTNRSSGLTQSPEQFASALKLLSRLRANSYVEVGINQAWTLCIVSAYLRRYSAETARFRGLGIDITLHHVHPDTRKLLHSLGVEVQIRGRHSHQTLLGTTLGTARDPAAPPRAGSNGGKIDVCFIDGDHSYVGVKRDFMEFRSLCNVALFHDIVDSRVVRVHKVNGGVPRFWQDIRAAAAKMPEGSSLHEFVQQPSTPLPEGSSFGIGVIMNPELLSHI